MKDKVAVVTGSSRGIGRAIAKRLAKEGALVAINYARDAEAAATTVAEIQADGGSAFAVQGDVGLVAEIQKFYDKLDVELTQRTGTNQFDILVNNAGIGIFTTVEGTTEKEFDRLFAVNVKGTFFITQMTLPRLRDGGRIINLSSGASRRPLSDIAVYGMTKAAIDNFTLVLAGELGKRGITVNSIAPGYTDTDANAKILQDPTVRETISSMTVLGRIGKVKDIASVAAFLALEDGGWVTGQYIEASGGFGLK
ncbi:short-chain dehydrogenase [Brasilonema octagenarum UFV-E1]|uniref:Short-chain dehydrogenase n=1 Tax=Brasilonema sennae CENA114 TaxID=415709 RepID=A0A856MEJ7_9CYAN|nr:SDR family oxidoreductase [Brasilonema sennae]QDL07477.1 short-chain dehydrogenase [Brasilonema sennae CENA114]QDL13839.1 short-chain dehydrogenase [Brasilonema octagenarum UFV-E1]